ncbi:MAG: Yip1 family protein [Bacillota bacterium]|nr:Yip1 family protein [Bacillota bacterium]
MFKRFFVVFFNTLFHPKKGFARISENRNIWNGLVVYLLINLFVSLAAIYFTHGRSVQEGFYLPPEFPPFFTPEIIEGVFRFVPLVNLLLQLVFVPLYFLLMVGILHLVAELFGGKGSVSSLGAVLGYGHIPYLIIALGFLTRDTALNIIGLLTIAAFLWSLWLKIVGLKIVNEFSWGRTVLVYFMPVISLTAAFLIFMLLSIVFLTPLLMQIIDGFISVPYF